MVATPVTIPLLIARGDKRQSLQVKAVRFAREAQDIYIVPAHEIKKAAITTLLKTYLFDELPKIFDSMVIPIKSEILKNEPFDAETYRESRICYESVKPFFDKVGEIKMPSNISDEKELGLYKSLVSFLNTIKDYIDYLEQKFSEFDKPKFESRFFTHIPESELWAIRNKKRPYLL